MSRQVLVFGGNGAVGRAVVTAFAAANWQVTSLDFTPNAEAARNVVAKSGASWEDQAAGVRHVPTPFHLDP